MFSPILLFDSILEYNVQLSCITLLQDKMSKHLRDTDDVDIDDNGCTTPKKTTSRDIASPIKVQFTPKIKTGKIVVQTKKEKDIITRLDEKTQHPFVSWGRHSVPKRPVDPTFLQVLPIDVDDP